MKKQRPRDHSQNEDQNPKPRAGRQPGDTALNRRKNSGAQDMDRTEIEEEPELKEKDNTDKKNDDVPDGEEIINKAEPDTSGPAPENGGKGKAKIVNKKN
ncbi:MAG: hypothetical protein ACXVPQ_10390 [Bacteroidia bacterium]